MKFLKTLQRGRAWKAYVEQALGSQASELARVSAALEVVQAETARRQTREAELRPTSEGLSTTLDRVASQPGLSIRFEGAAFERTVVAPILDRLPGFVAAEDGYRVLVGRRRDTLLVLFLALGDPTIDRLRGLGAIPTLEAALDGTLRNAIALVPGPAGRTVAHRCDALLDAVVEMPLRAFAWIESRAPSTSRQSHALDYFADLASVLHDLERIDFHALGAASAGHESGTIAPFDAPEVLPAATWAAPARKSALLLHNNYYHYNCLAAGLRARGWDVLTVSTEPPDSPQRQFYHGEDVNLYDPDPANRLRKTREFFGSVPERFGSLHFYGRGLASFFPDAFENTGEPRQIPWDFLELRRHRMVIGYMPSGCLDGGLQSSIRRQAENVCGRCVWELRPDVCSDTGNRVWNEKIALLCDWVGLECDHATPERVGPNTVYGPVVTALDPDRWHPAIDVPDAMRIECTPGEILVYHAVGNYTARRAAGRDIKGTGAVMAAIEQLKAEGLPIRLVFAHDVPSTQVRFLQVQADIVIDQLNYGRYGANAREALMLGRPTICHLNPTQAAPLPPLRPIVETPLVDADESSVTDVLRALVLAPARRIDLARRGRAFALAWHGQDAAAEKYERVVERVRAGLCPETPDLYPPPLEHGAA